MFIIILEGIKYIKQRHKFGNEKTDEYIMFNQDVLEFGIIYNIYVYFFWVFKYQPTYEFKWFGKKTNTALCYI